MIGANLAQPTILTIIKDLVPGLAETVSEELTASLQDDMSTKYI